MIFTQGRKVGIQRKEISDFIASVHDGRLSKEIGQMQQLDTALLVLEGKVSWTLDNMLVQNGYGYDWSWRQHHGVLWSIMSRGVWVDTTSGLQETIDFIRAFEMWSAKPKHQALQRRPGATGVWGTPSNKEYACHLVMGLPGVGPELAERIIDTFGVPFQWSITPDELMTVKGIGKEKARKIWEALA